MNISQPIDIERLADQCSQVLRAVGVPPDLSIIATDLSHKTLDIMLFERSRSVTAWSITVRDAHTSFGFDWPAEMRFHGTITPLALRLINLCDAALPSEKRKRERF